MIGILNEAIKNKRLIRAKYKIPYHNEVKCSNSGENFPAGRFGAGSSSMYLSKSRTDGSGGCPSGGKGNRPVAISINVNPTDHISDSTE